MTVNDKWELRVWYNGKIQDYNNDRSLTCLIVCCICQQLQPLLHIRYYCNCYISNYQCRHEAPLVPIGQVIVAHKYINKHLYLLRAYNYSIMCF